MPTVLTRDEIREVDDRVFEFVPVPAWSKEGEEPKGVFVQGLTGTARDSYEMEMIEVKRSPKGKVSQEINLRNLRAKLIVRCAYDSDNKETAKLLFSPADVEWLGLKSSEALQPIYRAAQRLSGLSNEDVEELGELLGEGQSDASGSDSPSPSGTEASPMLSAGSAAGSSPSGLPSTSSSPLETEG